MSDSRDNIKRFIDLVDQIGDDATGTFDILGIGKDERAHTRILAWLLRPTGSHGVGTTILSDLLSEAAIQLPAGIDTASISTFDQQPSQTELDVVIESGSTLIVIEIKTQGQLGPDQRDRQVDYLESVVAGDEQRSGGPFETWEYIYLSADPSHTPAYVDHQVTWDALFDLVAAQVGAVTRDTDAVRIREWIRFGRAHLLESEQLSPATELQLAFPTLVDQHDVNLDFATVRSDRQQLLSSIWQSLSEAHPAVTDGKKGWDTSRSRIDPGTKYVRFSKNGWPSGLRFEIQATEQRLTAGDNHSGPKNAYRTRMPHIEVTLTYSGSDKQERDQLLSHLARDNDELLRNSGFDLIREILPEDGPQFNDYHVYSKQVPIDFSDPEQTVAGIRQGLTSLLKLEQSLDRFES
ncbi:PD-(D/E)XK nuclease family protein [Halorubrum sp. SP9]|uniref:PD-(D/E)XK nuclease family protein n=1 Tax=Halorubrum sp. SP9 TaxID=1537267 RepID=UPI0010F98652|nr:PD-(D/E)XK nuclease family protein [Halorubrum sp. SP9]TKX69214.1 hypothetical protein EXE45_08810 [Halorubrum sp. SP9]